MDFHDRILRDHGTLGVEPVLFYQPNEDWGGFSNFSHHKVMLYDRFGRGMVSYRTGEHAFQARKMTTAEAHDEVAAQETAFAAKKAGGPRGVGVMRDGWGDDYGDLCFYVMFEVVVAKACQNEDIYDLLMATGQQPIYEDSPIDDIWGWRYHNDFRGKNLLGRCWEQARSLLWRP